MTRTITLLTLALALTGCPAPAGDADGPKTEASKDALDLAQKRGKLIVAMNPSYPPFETKGADGKPKGFDVDFAAEVCKDLGVELQLLPADWDGIIGILRTAKADAIFSGMSVTAERAEVVLFSEPYFKVGQVVVMRKGDDRFKSHTDLNDPKFTIAVEQATTGEQACKKSIPKAKLLRFKKVTEAVVAVQQKKADAVVFDNAFLLMYVSTKAKGDLEGIWAPFTTEDIAVATRKDSPKLQAAVNATLERLRKSGELDKLLLKHFGAGAVAEKDKAPSGS